MTDKKQMSVLKLICQIPRSFQIFCCTDFITESEKMLKSKYIKWSSNENFIESLRDKRKFNYKNFERNFEQALYLKFQKSMFGHFFDVLNKQQSQKNDLNKNKLDMLEFEMKSYSSKQLQCFEKNNDFCNNCVQILKKLVNDGKPICLENFNIDINILRLELLYVSGCEHLVIKKLFLFI